jgi:hypothetical protein
MGMDIGDVAVVVQFGLPLGEGLMSFGSAGDGWLGRRVLLALVCC